ncbi:hypothetical protein QNI19_08115 [Cytophagaceae bacterium DM2B3-1]|uniref:Uncharacterized protein n=1 Tax=Xanthocytophaga flava TaxID=3048013 RepID=A0ABT7CIM2_9BACT|nr:hypothetical protein [Xanthocytophaga flavus]MDJ1471122.1 hypothetical protein [Xanthocytophaga flavus]MDJ1492892.1 hypothetical protein [Xanthocytophaga flavus]
MWAHTWVRPYIGSDQPNRSCREPGRSANRPYNIGLHQTLFVTFWAIHAHA